MLKIHAGLESEIVAQDFVSLKRLVKRLRKFLVREIFLDQLMVSSSKYVAKEQILGKEFS